MHKKRVLYGELKAKVIQLESNLYAAAAEHDDLLMQIQSQSDHAWVELLLKKHLGMVPCGQTKVYFDIQ